jgi:hypothetical protein
VRSAREATTVRAQRKGLEATARGEPVRTYNRITITDPVAGTTRWTIFRAGLMAVPS